MTTRSETGLMLAVEGATPEELMRGLRAAFSIFDAAQVTPRQGAFAMVAREAWDIQGFPEDAAPTADQVRAEEAWEQAELAAAAACCAGWPLPLPTAHLSLG